jgi:hypothetical protein
LHHFAALNYFTADTESRIIADALLDDGYAIVEGLARNLTDQAEQELAPHINQAPFGHSEFLGAKTRRIGGLPGLSTAAQQLIIHPLVLGVCGKVLLKQCARFQLNFTGIMQLHPGEKAQVLHRDGLLYPFQQPHPPTLVQTMWAVTDFTRENGATMIVPESHLWEDQRWPQDKEIQSAEMPKGSVLFYQSGTIHGSGENCSDQLRTGISIQYSLGWLRTEENQHLSYPLEVAKNFPEKLQDLVGYEFGGPYLGFVNGDDPKRLLQDPGHDGPPVRSRPEIDAAQENIERIRLGDVTAIPTPKDRTMKPLYMTDSQLAKSKK